MIQDVDLLSLLPPFLAEYKEIHAALSAENPEFRAIWKAADNVLSNEFIVTADAWGVSRFEKMLGIVPEKEADLEDRRAAVLMKYNMRSPYTIRRLQDILAEVVGETNYRVELTPEEYRLMIQILNQDFRLVGRIYQNVLPVIPANMRLLFYGRYIEVCELTVKQQITAFRFVTGFYPLFNLPYLKLNNRWKLDGRRKLSGYNVESAMDLHPVRIRLYTGGAGAGKAFRETAERLAVRSGAGEYLKSQEEMAQRFSAEHRAVSEERVGVRGQAVETAGAGGIKMYNKNRLDGNWKLSGKRKLNGGIYQL
jgi:hypothetical protein